MKGCKLLTVGLLLFFIQFASSRLRSDPEVDRAVKNAVSFILSKRNQNTLEWKPLETSAAILGLSSGDPLWRMNMDKSITVTQTATALKTAFLAVLLSHGNDLSKVDDSTLAQFISAFQTSCLDPSNLYGMNLIAEAENRLEKIPQRSPSLAALALPICNQKIRINPSVARKLKLPQRNNVYACESLCVVKAALNILALSCMFKEDKVYSLRYRKLMTELLQDNIIFIQKQLATQSYESNFFDKIAILQANDVSPIPLDVGTDRLFDNLLALQESDGSFGDSVSLTAIAIPALSHFNALDVRSIKCPKEEEEKFSKDPRKGKIFYEISDKYLDTQTLVGEFVTDLTRNSNLYLAIKSFHDKYPEIFRFETKRTSFGVAIQSLIGIKSSRISTWNVFVKSDGSVKEENVKDLEKWNMKNNDKVIFRYEEA